MSASVARHHHRRTSTASRSMPTCGSGITGAPSVPAPWLLVLAAATLFDVDRHIVVRPSGGLVSEVVHNDAELARYLNAHPGASVVYDAADNAGEPS